MKKRVDNRVCIVYSSYCSDAEQLTYATVAQLVEYDLAKVGVAGSNPVCRSYKNLNLRIEIFSYMITCIFYIFKNAEAFLLRGSCIKILL